jgi:hypothetical protein
MTRAELQLTATGLPRRPRGRPNGSAEAAYQASLEEFCARILKIRSRLDFEVGTRGWCYLIEGERIIDKGEFDTCEQLITRCRKDGNLPLDICAEDDKRAPDGLEVLDERDVETHADDLFVYIENAHSHYTPISFWDDLDVYLQMATEKGDLKSLFARVARPFRIAIQNVGGWGDLNVRGGMMRRFKEWEAKGKQCVLLYCGDHDPGGLHISDYLRSNLEELAHAVGWSPNNLIIDRFGLDYDFIEANNLTWIDNLETSSGKNLADPKHPDHFKPYVQSYLKRFGARKVEANALVARPEAGRELCRQAILRYVPETAISDYRQRLAVEREKLRQAIVARMAAE